MKYIIVLIIIAIVLWKAKPYLTGLILDYKNKKNKKVIPVNDEFIYTPILSSRTFTFSIEIDEIGDGKVKININHLKD